MLTLSLGEASAEACSARLVKCCQYVIISGARLPLQVIAEHLFQEGKFTVGERFVEEAGVMNGEQLQQPFTEMHEVLERVSAVHARVLPFRKPLAALHRGCQVLTGQMDCSRALQVQLLFPTTWHSQGPLRSQLLQIGGVSPSSGAG